MLMSRAGSVLYRRVNIRVSHKCQRVPCASGSQESCSTSSSSDVIDGKVLRSKLSKQLLLIKMLSVRELDSVRALQLFNLMNLTLAAAESLSPGGAQLSVMAGGFLRQVESVLLFL